jgi:hypothetical protein
MDRILVPRLGARRRIDSENREEIDPLQPITDVQPLSAIVEGERPRAPFRCEC